MTLLVGDREALHAVGNFNSGRFGSSEEARILLLLAMGFLRLAIGAIGTACTVGAIRFIRCRQVDIRNVERLVDILHLQAVEDREDTTCDVEVIMYFIEC